MFDDSLTSVFGTRGRETTHRGLKGRNIHLIETDKPKSCFREETLSRSRLLKGVVSFFMGSKRIFLVRILF